MSRLGLFFALSLATFVGCASKPFSAAPVDSATARPQAVQAQAPVAVPKPAAEPAQPTPPPQPAPEVVVTPLEPAKETRAAEAHIALLLPLMSRDFNRAAEVVREGFEAAAAFQSDKALRVKVYGLDNEADALLAAYQEATAAGARCIVAGLTRDGAAALATSRDIRVPTLALNDVDQAQIPSAPFYTFSLSLDGEARQVARMISSQGSRRVAVLTGPSGLSKRVRDAFERQWLNLGGQIAVKLDLGADTGQYGKFRAALQGADAIFIAAESARVRQVMPFIAGSAPTFATSQVYDGKSSPGANVDLQDIRFVDMPWMVEPTHPAVAVYPRSAKSLGADLDRLYARGIDAYRLASVLANDPRGLQSLDGVTGKITLSDGHQFQRELTPAYFDGGQALPLNLPAQ